MRILKPFLLLLFLTVVILSSSINSFAQQAQDLRIKNQAGAIKKKSKKAIRKKDHKNGSSIGNQKVLPPNQTNPTSDFRGEPPVSLPVNPDKLQRDMAKYKGTDLINGPSSANQLNMSKFLGNKIFSKEYKKQLMEIKSLSMSGYLGNKVLSKEYKKSLMEKKNIQMSNYTGSKVLTRDYKRGLMEIKNYQMSIFIGNKVLSRDYKRGLMEIKNYQMSKFIGNKVLTRDYKRGLMEIKNYQMSKFIGNKVLTRDYRRGLMEVKNYHMSTFMGNKVYTREYKRSLMEIKNYKMSIYRGERLKTKKQPFPLSVFTKKSEVAGPTYDSRESEIWVKPRNADGTEMTEQPVKRGFFKRLFKKKNRGPGKNKIEPGKQETKPVKDEVVSPDPNNK